jgi:hypothetical protein
MPMPQLILPLVQLMLSMTWSEIRILRSLMATFHSIASPCRWLNLLLVMGAVHLVVETLAQDGVVGLTHADVINHQIAHHARFLTADVDLRHRAKPLMASPLMTQSEPRTSSVNVLRASSAFAYHFAAFLQNKAAAAIAG